jgi:histidine phosphotransfer protein HptB
MSYNPGALEAALAAAVGDEPLLIAELRGVFFENAKAYIVALTVAKSIDDWHDAARRLHSLAASFGVVRLMDVASQAVHANHIDPAVLRKIERAMAALDL